MDFMPYEGGPQTPIRPLTRVILGGLTGLVVAVGAAAALARPTSGHSGEPTAALHAVVPADAHRDLGPRR